MLFLGGGGAATRHHNSSSCLEDNIEVVKQHLAAGTDVNVKNRGGQVPLHQAAMRGYKEIVELLLAKGADVNAKDENGFTLLHDVALGGQKEIAELLIANDADVNAKDNIGWTPLNYAVFRDLKEIAELLIAAGTDLNAKDIVGRTPLHQAAYRGHKKIVELLIAAGADVNANEGWVGTPLDWAEPYEDDSPEVKATKTETADLLRKHGGKTGEELALMPRLVQHGRFAFSFDAKEGKVYEVQDSFDLLNWEVIKTYTGTGASVRFDEERDHDPPKIFYRVKVVD